MHKLNISLVELATQPRQYVDVYIGEKSYVTGTLIHKGAGYEVEVKTFGSSHTIILFRETPSTKITFEGGRFVIRGVSIQ